MTRRAIVALGIGQLINWGVLYYAFTVLLLPWQHELQVPAWTVAGAFSLALLVSALVAPLVGRWSDRGQGARLIRSGGWAAAVLLLALAARPSLVTLYVTWAGLGLCMAAILYEPAFAVVGRAHAQPADRLRAIATISVFGSLASTVFLPVTAILVERLEWRGAVVGLALALAASAEIAWRGALRTVPDLAPIPGPSAVRRSPTAAGASFPLVLVIFAAASLAHAALTSNLVPAFAARDITPTTAAALGMLIGLMQLPGRAVLMHRRVSASPYHLLMISLTLQAGGLLALSVAPSLVLIGVTLAIYAAGAGMATLVRPHLVQTLFGLEQAGHLNGRLARAQQLARAAGPVAAVWIAGAAGYTALFVALGALFVGLAAASRRRMGAAEPRNLSTPAAPPLA